MFQRLWKQSAALLTLAVCATVAPGCRPARPGEVKEVVPELKLEEVRFRVWRGAELRAFGDADTASLRRDSTELTAQDLAAVLPGRGKEPARLEAREGSGVLADRTFSARGGVTLRRGDDTARTAAARFEPGPEGGTVRGDDPVTVVGRGYRLDGTGFTLDPRSGDIVVNGAARLVAGVAEDR
jgi:lipopolysaccharide export system protein LptC